MSHLLTTHARMGRPIVRVTCFTHGQYERSVHANGSQLFITFLAIHSLCRLLPINLRFYPGNQASPRFCLQGGKINILGIYIMECTPNDAACDFQGRMLVVVRRYLCSTSLLRPTCLQALLFTSRAFRQWGMLDSFAWTFSFHTPERRGAPYSRARTCSQWRDEAPLLQKMQPIIEARKFCPPLWNCIAQNRMEKFASSCSKEAR
jgi:hypothetical protein